MDREADRRIEGEGEKEVVDIGRKREERKRER